VIKIRIDSTGNIYGTSSEFGTSYSTISNVVYTELDTGKQKIGETGKTYGELPHTDAGAAGIKRTTLIDSSITMTSLYQDILSYTPLSSLVIQGWIDISNLAEGDTMFVEVSLNNKTHSILQYTNVQIMPMLHVDTIIVGAGDLYKVQVKQTSGTFKSISYKFFKEE